ncbi:MAG TPA: hypothetical protein VM754_06895 [Actinomycetota bacterium]|nr:hypothetical protein [Actinomycetota bacterium]
MVGAEDSPAERDANTSPLIGGRRVALLLVLGCLLAVVMNPALVANLDKVPAADSADRLFQSWQLAWNGHALLRQPFDFLDSNAFWPLDNSVAFSDALFGFTPAGLVGSGSAAAVVRYNLVFLFTYVTAFAAAALLARELGLRWPAAVLAGAAFAFAPWRLSQHNHLHVLGSAPIPLSLFFFLRGYRRRAPWLVFAGFLAATWQVAIGFTLGVHLAYLLALLEVLAGYRWWRSEPRPALGRGVLAASWGGAATFAGWSGLQAYPYLKVLQAHPEARRTADYVRFYSPPPRGFLAAPAESAVWGKATEGVRQTLAWVPEMTLFPGLTVLVLAAAGLALPVLSMRWRIGLAAALAVSAVLALGYSFLGGRFTYGLLFELAPGWQSSRTSSRVITITILSLALLAGAGAQGAGDWVARRRQTGPPLPRRSPLLAVLLPGLFTVAVLAEGLGNLSAAGLTTPPVRQLPTVEPQIHLPTDDFDDLFYMFWSIDGFPAIVNGYSGFTPALLSELRGEMAGFPDQPSVARLQELGVRMVVLHLDRVNGTAWAGAGERPVEGLPVARSEEGSTVLYELEPGRSNGGPT